MARLSRLLGTDEGFFLLALHSFVESFICDVFPSGKYTASFPQLLWDFKEFLKRKGAARGVSHASYASGAGPASRLAPEDAQAIIRIAREHPTANKVRHGFQELGREEAVAASFNFWDSAARAKLLTRSWTPSRRP
jgi:hypothetical protein